VTLAGLGGYALGLRGDVLMFAAFLAVWPLNAVLLRITVRTFPPDIELTGEFRGILYDDPGARDHSGTGKENPAGAPSSHGS
jgi:hypothetical protein